MNKIALSLLVIAASAAYVWDQTQQQPDPLNATLLDGQAQAAAPSRRMPELSPAPAAASLPFNRPNPVSQPVTDLALQPVDEPATYTAALQPVPPPQPTLRDEPVTVRQAAMALAATAGLIDGTYTGPAVSAYYGLIQIQAVVGGGQLIGIKVLQYPSDRRTSIAINRQALPMLRDEAVAAQSANVDIVTGATLTSEAFIRSLGSALQQVKS